MNSEILNKAKELSKKQWIKWVVVLILMVTIIALSSQIRLSNLDLLKDETTGDYIPLALDPYYFMRMAETIMDTGNNLPEYDSFRSSPEIDILWLDEILPSVLAHSYKLIGNVFDISFRFYDVISPVIFYIIGIILFFILCYVLTSNKWLSLGASSFLAVVGSYLYRTMAGFSDHESIGMASLFLCFLVFTLAIKYLSNKKSRVWWKSLIFGALIGLTTTIVIGAWGGVASFLFIIFPLSYFLIWIFNSRKKDLSFIYNSLIMYFSWIIFTLIMGLLFHLRGVSNYFTGTTGIISLAIFAFMIIDGIFQFFEFKFIREKFRVLYSLVASAVLGFIGLFIIGKNPFRLLGEIVKYLIKPFGDNRVGLTVAENAQPYLVDWIGNTGSTIFWLFVFGIALFGVQLMRNIKKTNHKVGFIFSYLFMISGILFSRISAVSSFDGISFISNMFYFIPLLFFWIYLFYLYFNDNFRWKPFECFLFSWMFFTIISGRAAARMFFAITPFVCFMAAYSIYRLIKEYKVSKDDVLRIVLVILIIFSLVVSTIAISKSYQSIKYTAQYTSPSAHAQWQKAMKWVRENTDEDSIFGHWWDYGYWVQTLGERVTIADGGYHPASVVHPIGRYVLTTPNPETAYSYLKTMDVDYLLIDPTEIGKYSAFSKIGSDENWDRFSMIPTGVYDPTQVKETANETIMAYNIRGVVDEDMKYDVDGDGIDELFLPGPSYDEIGSPTYRAYLGAVLFKKTDNMLLQSEGIYLYNNQQYRLPVRYTYFDDELYDFGNGVDAVIMVVPGVSSNSVDMFGGMIYLSPKVKDSLFAQVYLLDDAFGQYSNIELVHEELDDVVNSVRASSNGVFDKHEFMFYNGGFRGPIKIYNVSDYPVGTSVYEELKKEWSSEEGMFGSFDYLFE